MVYAFEYDGFDWDAVTKLAYPKSFSEYFGTAVDIDNDIIVVGSSYFDGAGGSDQGAAHVYRRPIGGWDNVTQPEAELSSSVPGAFDYFGASVSVSGGVVVVGAPGADGTAGSVSSFEDSGGSWLPVDGGEIAGGGAVGDYFGDAVAIHEGTAVFGAWGVDGGSFDVGGVSFYRYDGRWNDYLHQAPSNLPFNVEFGGAVAVSGDKAVVGSPLEDTIGGNNSGAAYFYVNVGSAWVEDQIINPSDHSAFDLFGFEVSISGDTAVVGAIGDRIDLDSFAGAGSVYIFNYDSMNNIWVEGQKLSAPVNDRHIDQQFGVSVAIEGSTLVVGARHDSIGSQTHEGAAYVFALVGNSWVQTQRLVAPVREAGALFGISVGISDDTIVIGSWGNNKAYVFEPNGNEWPLPSATLAHPDPNPVSEFNGPRFGWSVAISNGVIGVGAPASASPDPLLNKGAAFLFRKDKQNGWVQEEIREGKAAGDEFGYSVALSTVALPNNQRFVVGSGLDSAGSATAYRYDGQSESWNFERTFYPSASGYDAWFGEAVAISDDSILIGAYSHRTGGISLELFISISMMIVHWGNLLRTSTATGDSISSIFQNS